jgi:hypothetical protein
MLVDQNDAGIFKFSSEALTGENAAFTVTGTLPDNARDTTRIRIRSTSGVITMPFVITGIEVINLGSRGDQTPKASDFNITNLTQSVSSVTPVSITPKPDMSTGTITIYYDGSETLPTAAGSYAVTFDVGASEGWAAVTGLSAGTLVITEEAIVYPITVFTLADWVTDHSQYNETTSIPAAGSTNSASESSPFRMNGTVPAQNTAYIQNDGSMLLFISAAGQGLHIMTNADNLDLDPVNKRYDLKIDGTVYADGTSSSSGPNLRINPMNGSNSGTQFDTAVSHTPGFEFSLTYNLPAETITSIRVTVSSAAVGMTFKITKIEIIDNGPR